MRLAPAHVAVAVVLSIAATCLPLVASPAAASAPVEKMFVTADTNGDGRSGLYTKPTPTGPMVKVFERSDVSVSSLTSSLDGSRVIYCQKTFSTTTHALLSWQVVVRDVSGTAVRVLANVPADNKHNLAYPALSPDGNTAAWSTFDVTTDPPTVSTRVVRVGSGTPTTLAKGLSPYLFLDDATLLVQDMPGHTFTIPVGGGTPRAASGIPLNAFHMALSPDRTRVAWALGTSGPDTIPATSDIQIAPVNVTNGVATVGTATTLDSQSWAYDVQPSFSRDGTSVYFTQNDGNYNYDGTVQGGDVWVAPADGSAPAAATAATSANEGRVAIVATDDGTAPGATTALPAILNGTSATVRWTLPTDSPDLSGAIVTRKLGTTTQKAVYVPAPATSYVDTGLVTGSTYTYAFQAIDRSNHRGAAATRMLTALKGAPSFANPTSSMSAKASFPVTFGPANGTFTVDYVPSGSTTWRHWVAGTNGRVRTFGAAASTGVLATRSTPGTSYTFRVKATDGYGNATPWVTSARAVVPFDQNKANLYGGSTVSRASAYLGSVRKLWTTSSYAKVTLVGNRLQVVGQKCPSCGKFSIYAGSTLLGTVDTYSSSTKVRQVLFTKSYTRIATRTFTIRPKATSGRPNVVLDGFAMRR